MSYRKFYKLCKRFFPNVYCCGMTPGFRIVKDKTDLKTYMEFYSLADADTRYDAWRKAASQAEHVYQHDQAIKVGHDEKITPIIAIELPSEGESDG